MPAPGRKSARNKIPEASLLNERTMDSLRTIYLSESERTGVTFLRRVPINVAEYPRLQW